MTWMQFIRNACEREQIMNVKAKLLDRQGRHRKAASLRELGGVLRRRREQVEHERIEEIKAEIKAEERQ